MNSDIENGVSVDSSSVPKNEKCLVVHRKRAVKMFASLIQYSETPKQLESNLQALEQISALPDVFALIGLQEIYLKSLYKALLVEYVGTAAFVYFHIAIVTAGVEHFSYPPLLIGIAHAFLLPLFIYQFAMSSGAHLNSLVTIASITTGHIPLVRGLLYIGVQIFGAVSGASVMYQSVDNATSETIFLGGCSIGSVSSKQALAIEFFFSLALLFPIYGMAFNLRQREIFGPVIPPIFIGLMLGLIIFASASLAPPPFTGAGANPSMCLGIAWALSQTPAAGSSDALNHQWIYWVGPMMASLVNAVVYNTAPPFHDVLAAPPESERADAKSEQQSSDQNLLKKST